MSIRSSPVTLVATAFLGLIVATPAIAQSQPAKSKPTYHWVTTPGPRGTTRWVKVKPVVPRPPKQEVECDCPNKDKVGIPCDVEKPTEPSTPR